MAEKVIQICKLTEKEECEYRAFHNDKQYIYPNNYVPIDHIKLNEDEVLSIYENPKLQERLRQLIYEKHGTGTYNLRLTLGGPGGYPRDKNRKVKYKQDKKYGIAKPCGFRNLITLEV